MEEVKNSGKKYEVCIIEKIFRKLYSKRVPRRETKNLISTKAYFGVLKITGLSSRRWNEITFDVWAKKWQI